MKNKTDRIIQITKAIFKKNIISMKNTDVSASGPKIKIDLSMKGLSIPVRKGLNPQDKVSPFYESDFNSLYRLYYGYTDSSEFDYELLYAEVTYIKPMGLQPITRQRCIDQEAISVTLEAAPFFIAPKLQSHAKEAVRFFKELNRIKKTEDGEWENNIAFRVNSFSETGAIECSLAEYFDQVGTNITLDWASGQFKRPDETIRSSIERHAEGKLPSLRRSILANTLGTAVMFYDRDLQPAVRVRSQTLASITDGGLHCTVSGVLEPRAELSPEKQYDFSIFLPGTQHEIKQETGLSPDQYLLFPVAFARELPRGGKPQLFWVAISLVDHEAFRKSCAEAEEASEYLTEDELDFDLPAELIDEGIFLSKFTYEGRASYHFGKRFVHANRKLLMEIIASTIEGGGQSRS